MQISKKGIDLIKQFEGLRLKPYLDVAGIPTIGYGNTYYDNGRRVSLRDEPITEERAEVLLGESVRRYADAVSRYVQVSISQNQFDALVSFAYNVGNEALRKSTLLLKLNKWLYKEAGEEFDKWVYANGERVQGLVNRRAQEKALFLTKDDE